MGYPHFLLAVRMPNASIQGADEVPAFTYFLAVRIPNASLQGADGFLAYFLAV